jgi:hypothetical protein
MQDLTIIYLTLNEVPESFAQFQRKVLLDAVGDTPIISVSRKPIDLGMNLLDTNKKSYINIYRQMLRAAKLATTEYVAVAEDDCLYPKEHYELRPHNKDTFLYNQNRWALFTWGVPTYSMRQRKSNCTLIAPIQLMIDALEERFAKYPLDTMPQSYVGELGREMVEKGLGVTPRRSVEVFSEVSVIQINHDNATEDRQKRHRKSLGQIKAYNIPHWGKASDLIINFK